MPLVTITGMHGNPCTLPTDMPCALYSTSQYYGLSKSFKVLRKNYIFFVFIYLSYPKNTTVRLTFASLTALFFGLGLKSEIP